MASMYVRRHYLFKGIYLSKALSCMKMFLYKQELLFCQRDGYLWPHGCMNNLYISKIAFVASSFFIYDEEITIRKRTSVLRHIAATEACDSLVFASSRSSEMYICSSLVALMVLSFSPPLMKIVSFCSTGFYSFLL